MLLPLVLAAALLAQAQSAPSPQPKAEGGSSASKPAAPPANLEAYQLVILQRPEHPREYAEDKLEEIQQAHLAHLRELAQAGKLLVAGPLDDQPDPRLRGIEIFRVGSLEEAKRLAADDPAVKAGRLEPVVMTWFTEKGALAFPIAERLRKRE
ncbi:MAG: YciI family protein [Thermoanaerobaculia bacterium]